MDHSYFKDRISAYYDRDLPPYELQAVEEHLKDCAECQALLAEFEKLDRMVAEKSELAEGDYWEQSAQKIERALGFEEKTEVIDVRPKSWRGLGWKIATVAASVAVITFIGLHEGDILQDKTQTAPSLQSDSPASKIQYMTTPPKLKTEAVSDSAPTPVHIDEEEVGEKAGVPVSPTDADIAREIGEGASPKGLGDARTLEIQSQLPKAEVVEKSRTSIQSAETDVLEEAGKKSPRGKSPDLSQTKSVAIKDMISSEPTADFEVKKPTVNMRETPAVFAPGEGGVALSKEKVDRGLAEAEEVYVGSAGTASLPALRQQRDSLMALYLATYGADTAGQVEQMAVMADKQVRAAKATAPDSTVNVFERQLIDVHYRIAQFTEDKNEREASVRFLKAYADRTDVQYADQARRYYESIESAGN
jgi:hypothetical protein